MKLTKYQKEGIVRAIMADVPSVQTAETAREIRAKLFAALDPELQAIETKFPGSLKTGWVPLARNYDHRDLQSDVVVGNLTESQVEKITEPYNNKLNERRELENKLKDVFNSLSTVKQAHEAFPEFAKYLPTVAQPTKNLPALANLVADMTRLGWPKQVSA